MKKLLFSISLSIIALGLNAQTYFEGRVLSKDHKPIADASVNLDKTNTFISTNDSGYFKLAIAANLSTPLVLNVSRVGYVRKKVEFKKNSGPLFVIMETEDQSLNDVVVVGYGTLKKRDVTGSVVSLSKDRLQQLPNNNFTQALEGSLPGVTITTNTGGAEGNMVSILIGGRNSIKADTKPLIIMDGIPFEGGFSDINPDDILSIEILKDASAVAIYGSRGSNGVILITGKSGKKGKNTISLDVSYGTQKVSKIPNLLNPSDFYNFKLNRNAVSLTPSEDSIYANGTGVNWFDLATQTGTRSNVSLSINGGNEQTTYYLGVASLNVDGIAKGDVFKRYTLRPSLDIKINKFINVGTNNILTVMDRSGTAVNFSGANGQGANLANPLTTPFNPDGTPSIFAWPEYHLMGNPLNNLLIWNSDFTYKLFTSNYIKVALPIPGLSYRINGGAEISNRTVRTSWSRNTTNGFTNNGEGEYYSSVERSFTLENILSYIKEFGEHSINITALYSSQSHDFQGNDTRGYGFPSLDMNFAYNLDQATTTKSSSTYAPVGTYTSPFTQNRVSQKGRINYGYKGKYLATLTSRRDGYSGFGVDNKYGIFTTGALAWNLNKESFIHLPSSVTQLKVRASYGLNGNEAIKAYQTQTTLNNNYYVTGGPGDTTRVGYIPYIAGNPVMAWEATRKFTGGVDFGFFNNRISGSVEYYKAQTGNPGLLLQRSVSPVTGYTSVLMNIGKVQNTGVELMLNTKNVVTPNFSWSSTLVMAYNKNKIVSIYGDGKNDTLNTWFIGHPINVNFDLVYDGIYKTAQDSINSPIKSPAPQLGYVRIKDLNGDSIISTAKDRTILGQLDPKITWGFTNTFMYKRFSLSIFIQGVSGVTKEDPLQQDNVGTDVTTNTTKKDWWSPANPNGSHWSNNLNSNISPIPVKIYENANFIRLKDISFAYSFLPNLLKKAQISNLKIYASARNLITFTKYKGLDPELAATSQLNIPLQKEFTIGVNVGL